MLANLIVRTFQLIFVAVVLGLSIVLVKGQVNGGSPSQTNFAIACGVVGAIALMVGMVADFIEVLQGLVTLAVDALAALFFLAGGVALAVALGVHSCTSRPAGWNHGLTGADTPPNPYCTFNTIINGGAITEENGGLHFTKENTWFVSRCRESQALDAFLFLALFSFIASLGLGSRASRRSKTSAV